MRTKPVIMSLIKDCYWSLTSDKLGIDIGRHIGRELSSEGRAFDDLLDPELKRTPPDSTLGTTGLNFNQYDLMEHSLE